MLASTQSSGEKTLKGSPARMLIKAREVCELLGGIHPRTLSRMEKSGLIRSVKLLRHRMYLPEDVTRLVDNLRNWERRAA